MAAGLHEIFLDFLYPVQTHALIRRLNRATRSHCQAAQLAKQSSRNYTSVAEDLIAGNARKYTSVAEDLLAGKTSTVDYRQEQREQANKDLEVEKRVQAMHEKAEELLDRFAGPKDCDELWKLQQDAFEASQPLDAELVRRIFLSLSSSRRAIDRERSLALFETISGKTSLLYTRAVKAALKLNDMDTAGDIHREAAAQNPGSINIGTPDILKHAVQHDQWRRAVDIWYRLWRSPFVYFSVQRDLWKEVDALGVQELLLRTENAVDFATSMKAMASSPHKGGLHQETAVAARDFALTLVERAFEVRGVTFELAQHMKLLKKVKILSNTRAKHLLQALSQLLSLTGQDQLAAALGIYRELRMDPSFAPSQGLLEQMLGVFRLSRSPSALLMLLEDWQRYMPNKIPIDQYITIARVIADSGQADGMESLLRSFFDQYELTGMAEGDKTKILNCALRVHHKRADTRTLLQKFDEFQRQYNFVPNKISYNTIITAFARVGDVENTLAWFETLKQSGLPLDHHSFHSPMAMFAKRGDFDAVQDILEELEQNNMKLNMAMVNALVVANIKNERYEEAEKVVLQAFELDLEGPRTHMWNILLSAHALRANLQKVSELHQQMHQLGVPEDPSTYAALLTSLCQSGRAKYAWMILKKVMPRLSIEQTVFHYAILMKGFVRIQDYQMVFVVNRHMIKNRLAPNSSVANALLRATAWTDKKEMEQETRQGDFTRAHTVLDMTLKQLDPAALAEPMPRTYSAPAPLDEAFVSTHFEYMIYLYGKEAAFAKVTKIYDDYIAKAKELGHDDVENSLPMMMLSNLLIAHRRAGNDDEVERCWSLALDKLEKITKRANANVAEPGWVLYARRFNVSIPLREYLRHLSDRQRFDDMLTVVRDIRRAGYELYSHQWNVLVQYLSASPHARHHIAAFETCEAELMHDWPGWLRLAASDASHVGRSWTYMKRALRRENRKGHTMREKRMVQYRTVVQLAGVYRDAVSGAASRGGEVSRAELLRRAPVTVGAVMEMPRMDDREQNAFLPERDY